jgi:hypothetical protein
MRSDRCVEKVVDAGGVEKFGHAVHPQLAHQIGTVRFRRSRRNIQFIRDLFAAVAEGEQEENLGFSAVESKPVNV